MKFINLLLFTFIIITFSKTAHSQSVGGTTSGGTTYCTTTNSGFVSVSGYVGNILFWQTSTNGGATWSNNANTTPNQTYFNLAQTTCFRAVVQDGAFPTDTSTIVCINVYPPSVGGTLSGGGGTFCANSGTGTLTLSGNNGNVLFWLSSTNGGTTWSTIANTTNTLNYLNMTQSTVYVAVVQNGPSCPNDTSSQAIFTIIPASDAGTLTGGTSVCATSNVGTLTLSGYTGTITGWLTSTNNGASWTPVSNTTAVQNYLNLTQTTWYQVIVQSGSCTPDTSAIEIINVSPATVGGTITGGGTYCGVPATGTLTLSGNVGNVVSWISSTDNGITWLPITNTTATENYTNLPVTTWYAVLVNSAGCQGDTSSIEIVYSAPQTVAGTISSSATVCYGTNYDTLTLAGNVGNVLAWFSSIDNGVTWLPILNTTTSQIYGGLTTNTLFAALVQSGNCNIDTTNIITISVLPQNVISAGADTTIAEGQTVQLNGSGVGTPVWSPIATLDNPAVLNPIASPLITTVYTLQVTDGNGCVSSDNVVVTVILSTFDGIITNLFSPNGDGVNDTWYIENIQNFPDNEVKVYNIYGNIVYSKKGYTNDWKGTYNGTELPDGTYYYVLTFDSINKVFKGSVDIIRNK